jgi:hypothetical protein
MKKYEISYVVNHHVEIYTEKRFCDALQLLEELRNEGECAKITQIIDIAQYNFNGQFEWLGWRRFVKPAIAIIVIVGLFILAMCLD